MSRSKIITVVPELVTPAVPENFGEQLTEQYTRAIGGMREVLIFGAMLWKLRDAIYSACGKVATGGATSKDTGIKAWLVKHAPKVNLSTAYRFLSVTESISEEYAAIVGTRVAKQFALCDLVTTPAAQLPEAAREKQLSLFDYVAGTSQRSWLDRFKAPAGRGGDHGGAGKKGKLKSPEQLKAEMHNRCNLLGEALLAIAEKKDYAILPPADLDGLEDLLSNLLNQIKTWRKKPLAERELALAE